MNNSYNIFDNFFIIAQARKCLGTPHFRGFFSLLRRQRGAPHMRGTPLFYSRSIRPVLFLIIIPVSYTHLQCETVSFGDARSGEFQIVVAAGEKGDLGVL